MGWVVHVARMEAMENAYITLLRNPKGRKPFRRRRCRCEEILRLTLKLKDMWIWTGFNWLGKEFS